MLWRLVEHVQRRNLTSLVCRRHIKEASAHFTWNRAEASHCYSVMGHFQQSRNITHLQLGTISLEARGRLSGFTEGRNSTRKVPVLRIHPGAAPVWLCCWTSHYSREPHGRFLLAGVSGHSSLPLGDDDNNSHMLCRNVSRATVDLVVGGSDSVFLQ